MFFPFLPSFVPPFLRSSLPSFLPSFLQPYLGVVPTKHVKLFVILSPVGPYYKVPGACCFLCMYYLCTQALTQMVSPWLPRRRSRRALSLSLLCASALPVCPQQKSHPRLDLDKRTDADRSLPFNFFSSYAVEVLSHASCATRPPSLCVVLCALERTGGFQPHQALRRHRAPAGVARRDGLRQGRRQLRAHHPAPGAGARGARLRTGVWVSYTLYLYYK